MFASKCDRFDTDWCKGSLNKVVLTEVFFGSKESDCHDKVQMVVGWGRSTEL